MRCARGSVACRGAPISSSLLDPIATTAFQTMTARRRFKEVEDRADTASERPRFLGTCPALASDSPAVKEQWPEFYTGDG